MAKRKPKLTKAEQSTRDKANNIARKRDVEPPVVASDNPFEKKK